MLAAMKARVRKLVARHLRKHVNLELFNNVRATGVGLRRSYLVASSDHYASALLRHCGAPVLKRALRAMEAVGMRPYLMWGSLLGYRRDGGFIAHDYDVDVCITAPELAFIDALKAELAKDNMIAIGKSPFSFDIKDARLPEFWIDVWVMYEIEGHHVVSMFDHKFKAGYFVYRLPSDALKEFGEVVFEGCRIRAPIEVDRILDLCYGNWRVPDPDHYEDKCPCATLEATMPHVTPACTPFWPETR